ncbi:hypothetical protein M979_1224 [Buttiauxella noackiae ATCC 51607]|uniref:Uncharacterized protein n=1 Tax=Buttiauxella noackiae ATCC 51607 TaxID=1354255 RepID=A0A1B7HW73_9ENTR|nr:hypothetical protein M979_1224 [Buttiauxella noackiae ATCC 51607]
MFAMKDTVKHEFHHFGIPLQNGKEEGFSAKKLIERFGTK